MGGINGTSIRDEEKTVPIRPPARELYWMVRGAVTLKETP